ncbi:MAG: ABC transporter permease [Clostridia bacterium]|nr:ABC transporter permease [Clostridia bacterium]
MFVNILTNAIRFSATFLYGSTGEIITEKSGHLNLGIPGVMCVGSAVGCLVEYYLVLAGVNVGFLLVLLPLLATFASGGLMGLLYSFLTVTLKSNQNVVGLAMTTFGSGLCGYMVSPITGRLHIIAPMSVHFSNMFGVAETNWFTSIFLSHGWLFYLSIVIAIVAQVVLNHTRLGLHLRAVGENPATADAVGINVTGYRYGATVIGCGISALGGFFAVMEYMGGMWDSAAYIEGLGWLSVALVIFTLWRPALSIFGSIVFAALYILGARLSVSFAMIEVLKMLPYVVTIVVLIITSIFGSKKTQAPAALGLNYFREER